MTTRDALIFVTDKDRSRLKALIRTLRYHRRRGAYLNALERELRRARVVPSWEVPEDTVTMNSRVRVRDLDGAEKVICSVVYPEQAATKRIGSPSSRLWGPPSWATAWVTGSGATCPPEPVT